MSYNQVRDELDFRVYEGSFVASSAALYAVLTVPNRSGWLFAVQVITVWLKDPGIWTTAPDFNLGMAPAPYNDLLRTPLYLSTDPFRYRSYLPTSAGAAAANQPYLIGPGTGIVAQVTTPGVAGSGVPRVGVAISGIWIQH